MFSGREVDSCLLVYVNRKDNFSWTLVRLLVEKKYHYLHHVTPEIRTRTKGADMSLFTVRYFIRNLSLNKNISCAHSG